MPPIQIPRHRDAPATSFRNRVEAGRLLAERLANYADREDVVVVGVPRGGVIVAAEIARALRVPLRVFAVRRLELLGAEELALGAISCDGRRVINRRLVKMLGIPGEMIATATRRAQRKVCKDETIYQAQGVAAMLPNMTGRMVILVDDGIFTGASMLAAVATLRKCKVARLVIASPVAPPSSHALFKKEADELEVLLTPWDLCGVSQVYQSFPRVTNEEVLRELRSAEIPAGLGKGQRFPRSRTRDAMTKLPGENRSRLDRSRNGAAGPGAGRSGVARGI